MSDESDVEKLQLLVDRYNQIDQTNNHHNNIIHTTFYLSVVFFGALLTFATPFTESRKLQLAVVSFFSAIIFVAMGLWSQSYLQGRQEDHRQKKLIVEELKTVEYPVNEAESFTDFFTSREEVASLSGIKDKLIFYYYFVLAFVSCVLLVVVLTL